MPPEPLSFDPVKVAKFDTALPFGIRFIPVYSSSSHHDLKFMLADATCPAWKDKSRDILYSANENLSKNKGFN